MADGISIKASRFKGKNMQKIEWDSPAELVEVAENPLPAVGDAGYLFARDGKKLRNAVFEMTLKFNSTYIEASNPCYNSRTHTRHIVILTT